MNYASSEVREKLVNSESLDHAMNLKVLEYIDNHSLYTV
jgi:nicotinic acid mononucleotide adenylyltransferase